MEWEVRIVECTVWSKMWGLRWSVKLECDMWSGRLWSVKCRVWVQSLEWSVECQV